MPQITVGSSNIDTFGFSATFNPLAQSILFDTAGLTTYNNVSGSGYLYTLGVAFSVLDQDGVVLASVDWDNPQIRTQDGDTEYTLDLSSVGIDFFFQTYSIIGYIKDSDGTVYQTTQVNPKICQPVGITSGGYVPGIFQITANCPDNVLTIKEVTKLVYDNLIPESTTKSGTLTYPSGTISAVAFTGTPFTNDVIYTGQYRINCTTQSLYNLGNDIYVLVSYVTNNVFDITCANTLSDVLCCIVDIQRTKIANCNTAIGERAAQLEAEITIPFLVAIGKEISGQDASSEVAFIRKTLNCNCGNKSIIQNEFTPINPSVTNIVLEGVGGTSIATPTINGNTKTYPIKSYVYQVVKGVTGDTAFTIALDTSTANTVKYVITLNYSVLAQTILTTIGGNDTLLTQFNSLVNITNFQVDLTNLNGGCIIDLSSTNYFLAFKVPSGANTIVSILINGVTYTSGSPLVVNNPTAIESWLNGLGLGTFDASFSTGTSGSYFNLLTVGNANVVTSAVLNTGTAVTVPFQKTNKSLIAFLQAVVDYICALSDLEVALSDDITVCYVDYNGDTITTTYPKDTTSQAVLNAAIADALCNTVAKINQTFNNALTRSGSTVQWGGDLIKNTDINIAGFRIKINGDSNNYIIFDPTTNTIYNSQGTNSSDLVNVGFTRADLFVYQIATIGDRAAVSYYSTAEIVSKSTTGTGDSASIGVKIPATLNDATPAPANDPDKTAYVKAYYDQTTGFSTIFHYGRTNDHQGSVDDFDTLISAKQMTTAERDAIDAGFLTRNRIIFNTTTNKLQCWDLSTWNDLF